MDTERGIGKGRNKMPNEQNPQNLNKSVKNFKMRFEKRDIVAAFSFVFTNHCVTSGCGEIFFFAQISNRKKKFGSKYFYDQFFERIGEGVLADGSVLDKTYDLSI